jgi:hypothetical protein
MSQHVRERQLVYLSRYINTLAASNHPHFEILNDTTFLMNDYERRHLFCMQYVKKWQVTKGTFWDITRH